MPRRWRSTQRPAEKVRKKTCSRRCRRVTSSIVISATTLMKRRSIASSRRRKLVSPDPTDAVGSVKAKKAVALSGVFAGKTALCTGGATDNDLHYRGYDILEFADRAEFEEVAHLLVHERLPTAAELGAYKEKLKGLRAPAVNVKAALE